MQLDIIRETEVNITNAMADQSDSLAVERKNHKNSGALLAKVQDKLTAQPGDCSTSYSDTNIRTLKKNHKSSSALLAKVRDKLAAHSQVECSTG